VQESCAAEAFPDTCGYPLERAEALLRRAAPDVRVRTVRTAPPGGPAVEGPLRVLRQRVLADGCVELLVAAEGRGLRTRPQ
jgi:hypothetical protein